MAPTPAEIREAIAKSAEEGIDSVTIDGATVREKPLKERLEALRELEADESSAKPHFGLRFTRLVSAPPG